MLIKKLLEALPLTPGPKPPKKVEFTAGAAVHDLPRCGEVLVVDVYNRKGEPLHRFFSDGKNYTALVARAFGRFTPGWTERSPVGGSMWHSADDIAASPESIAAVDRVLKEGRLMERGCINFKCVRRRGYFCCADCRERELCQVPCQNSPERCGLARNEVPSSYEAANFLRARKDNGIILRRKRSEG